MQQGSRMKVCDPTLEASLCGRPFLERLLQRRRPHSPQGALGPVLNPLTHQKQLRPKAEKAKAKIGSRDWAFAISAAWVSRSRSCTSSLWKLGFDQPDSVGWNDAWSGGRACEPLTFGMVALSSGWTGGQAPSDPQTGLNATRPDIVCRMKSKILHLP